MNAASLKGKTALITGGACRIGKAIGLHLAQAGADIAIQYATGENQLAEETIKQVRAYGVRAWKYEADFSSLDPQHSLFRRLDPEMGSIDYLINNASIFPASDFHNFSAKDLLTTLTINTFTPAWLCRDFVTQTENGVIVNILDTRIKYYDRARLTYQLSKNMLFHLTELLALELAPGIRVNAVAPGTILPPPGQNQRYLERLASKTLLQKPGTVDDVTSAVIFLLTASYITGQILFVDGGYHVKGRDYDQHTPQPR